MSTPLTFLQIFKYISTWDNTDKMTVVHEYIYVYMHVYVYMHQYISMYIYMYIYMHRYLYKCVEESYLPSKRNSPESERLENAPLAILIST